MGKYKVVSEMVVGIDGVDEINVPSPAVDDSCTHVISVFDECDDEEVLLVGAEVRRDSCPHGIEQVEAKSDVG